MIYGQPFSLGSGVKLGVSFNDDDTQNLFISDNGTPIDYAAIPTDVAPIADLDPLFPAPTLLWTNPDLSVLFPAQTIALDGAEYSAYIVETRVSISTTALQPNTSKSFVNMGETGTAAAFVDITSPAASRAITDVTETGLTFANGFASGSYNANNAYAIPTRIWGVKFTL